MDFDLDPDQWISHGRAEVRPVRRRALPVDGEFRAFAGAAAPNPFDERAMASVEARADRFIDEAIREMGIG